MYIPYRSLILGLYTLNSPPVVSFNRDPKHLMLRDYNRPPRSSGKDPVLLLLPAPWMGFSGLEANGFRNFRVGAGFREAEDRVVAVMSGVG